MTDRPQPPGDERPPILGSWNRIYLLVLILHFLFIALFTLLTRSLS